MTYTEDGNFLLNAAPGLSGPDGIALLFTITGTTSGVLAVNTAPPGAAVALTNIPYLNGSLVEQSAGTAITASGLAYVSAAYAALDLYLVLNWTSGATVVQVSTNSSGSAGGGGGGDVPAGDVTPGTFGANSGSLGDYAVPDDFTVADLLTTSGTITRLSQSATTAAVNVGSGTGSGTSDLNVLAALGQNASVTLRAGTLTHIALLRLATTGNFALGAYDDLGALIDLPLTVTRAAAGAIYTPAGRPVGRGGAPGAATTDTAVGPTLVTAIPNNTATTIATITIPNVAATATIRITAQGALGAGGAIGAREAMAQNSYNISVVRTAGVAAVAAISTAYGATASAVAGAATCTAALTLAAVSGAVGATNTVAIQVTVIRSGGSSDNHTCTWTAEVLNAATGGITLA